MTGTLAFYTYFYGSTQNPACAVPRAPSSKYPCFYISNNKAVIEALQATDSGWTPVFHDIPVSDDLLESCMSGKHIKTMPHECPMLQAYDYLCYLDTKVQHVSEEFVERYIQRYFVEQNYALLLRKHWFIQGSVWKEYEESMRFDQRYKAESERYRQYIHAQIAKGLQETVEDHCACGFLIRNMKHPATAAIGRTWFEHIQECGIQDQLSFYFVKQLFPGCIHAFAEIPFL